MFGTKAGSRSGNDLATITDEFLERCNIRIPRHLLFFAEVTMLWYDYLSFWKSFLLVFHIV